MRRVAVAALAALALAFASCGEGEEGSEGRPRLTVSAAASLSGAFGALKRDYPAADLRFSFAGSDELAAQIRQGVTPDVFASADTKLPEALAGERLVERPMVFATNELVLAVPAEGAEVSSLTDLERNGVKLAVGSESVPVGEYTREVLSRLGEARSRTIQANVGSEEPDVKGVVGKIAQGAVDAGFVYRSDVEASGRRLRAVDLPTELRPKVSYGVAVVRGAEQLAAARAFVRSLLSGRGRRALRDAGLGPPP
ncbi:MAG: molybdate ABC transporter substrate-binding protein [Actinomycetota bacterium]|nr:molybdate ABC transporter substrate-binding protein [Actinomycetota bacterium]